MKHNCFHLASVVLLIVLLTCLLLLSSCGTEEQYIEPEFQPTVEHFLRLSHEANKNTAPFLNIREIVYKNLAYQQAEGLCLVMIRNSKIKATNIKVSRREDRFVYVDTKWKGKANIVKYILYHEMAHCTFNADHSSDPRSLMYGQIHYEIGPEEMLANYLRDGL